MEESDILGVVHTIVASVAFIQHVLRVAHEASQHCCFFGLQCGYVVLDAPGRAPVIVRVWLGVDDVGKVIHVGGRARSCTVIEAISSCVTVVLLRLRVVALLLRIRVRSVVPLNIFRHLFL